MLLPNRVALVAEIAEEWTTPVDVRMEQIGGIVYRWTLPEVMHDQKVDSRERAVPPPCESYSHTAEEHSGPDTKSRSGRDQYQDRAETDLPSNALLGE